MARGQRQAADERETTSGVCLGACNGTALQNPFACPCCLKCLDHTYLGRVLGRMAEGLHQAQHLDARTVLGVEKKWKV